MTIDTAENGLGNNQQTANLYEKIWNQNLYQGFSKGTQGARSTSFLDAFIAQVKNLNKKLPKIVELGAGSGDHALRLVSENFDVTAIESSATAVRLMQDRLKNESVRFSVFEKNLFQYVQSLEVAEWDGVYANAVFHFLTVAERLELYAKLFQVQHNNGILAVSFKGIGDALQKKGKLVEDTPAGPVVEGVDLVKRLYVSDPNPLIDEMRNAGYQFIETIEWSIPNYNIPGENGVFVGLLAKKSYF